MNHTENHNTDNLLSNTEKWGYSFLGNTLGLISIFVAPLLFSLFERKILYKNLSYFGLFGSGIIVTLVVNHNLLEIIELVGFNWKVATTFMCGIFFNKIFLYGLYTEDHCCELEEPCPEETCQENQPKCCNEQIEVGISNRNEPQTSVTNIYSSKHWSIPILLGDAFCNLSDGLVITTAFNLCGISTGLLTTLAVVLHEVSHEIGDFALMLKSGLQFNEAIFYNFLSGCATYIGWLIINLTNNLDSANEISAYLLTFGSGALLSIAMTIIPKYLKDKELGIQRLKLIVLLLGFTTGSIMFGYLNCLCEKGHNHGHNDHHDDH